MHNVVGFLYYTARSCFFNDDLDLILSVPLLIVYSVGSGVISPKLCNFGNLKLRWRLHQSQNKVYAAAPLNDRLRELIRAVILLLIHHGCFANSGPLQGFFFFTRIH